MFAFRIIRNAYAGEDDGIPAYRDIVQANYDNGNFSQQINSCDINYDGDVNIFAYNVSSGKGCLAFEDVDTPLKAEIYSVTGRTDGMDNIWKENMLTKSAVHMPDISIQHGSGRSRCISTTSITASFTISPNMERCRRRPSCCETISPT